MRYRQVTWMPFSLSSCVHSSATGSATSTLWIEMDMLMDVCMCVYMNIRVESIDPSGFTHANEESRLVSPFFRWVRRILYADVEAKAERGRPRAYWPTDNTLRRAKRENNSTCLGSSESSGIRFKKKKRKKMWKLFQNSISSPEILRMKILSCWTIK